jgi:hypothetical protein
MTVDIVLILIVVATAMTGLLAGASLDKAVVQLPARHRLGIAAFAAFSRANDLGRGLFFYPFMGISAALLTILAGLDAILRATPLAQAWPLYVAVLLAILHSIATSRAAPNMLSLGKTSGDEKNLAATLDRFAFWHNVRAVLQVLDFFFLIWAMLAYPRGF